MKKVAAAFIAGVVFASASSVFAGEAIKKIQASLASDVTVKVDGKNVALHNTPITYNGATYLPVRDAANAVGAGLKWDAKTKTVEFMTNGGQQKGTSATNAGNQEGGSDITPSEYVQLWTYDQQMREKSYTFLVDFENKTLNFVHLSDKDNVTSADKTIYANIPIYIVNGSTSIEKKFFEENILPLIQ